MRVLAAIRKTAPASKSPKDVAEETMETDAEKPESKEVVKEKPQLTGAEAEMQSKIDKLTSILSGEKPIYLNLQFLIRNDHTDPLILKQTKDAVQRKSVGRSSERFTTFFICNYQKIRSEVVKFQDDSCRFLDLENFSSIAMNLQQSVFYRL